LFAFKEGKEQLKNVQNFALKFTEHKGHKSLQNSMGEWQEQEE